MSSQKLASRKSIISSMGFDSGPPPPSRSQSGTPLSWSQQELQRRETLNASSPPSRPSSQQQAVASPTRSQRKLSPAAEEESFPVDGDGKGNDDDKDRSGSGSGSGGLLPPITNGASLAGLFSSGTSSSSRNNNEGAEAVKSEEDAPAVEATRPRSGTRTSKMSTKSRANSTAVAAPSAEANGAGRPPSLSSAKAKSMRNRIKEEREREAEHDRAIFEAAALRQRRANEAAARNAKEEEARRQQKEEAKKDKKNKKGKKDKEASKKAKKEEEAAIAAAAGIAEKERKDAEADKQQQPERSKSMLAKMIGRKKSKERFVPPTERRRKFVKQDVDPEADESIATPPIAKADDVDHDNEESLEANRQKALQSLSGGAAPAAAAGAAGAAGIAAIAAAPTSAELVKQEARAKSLQKEPQPGDVDDDDGDSSGDEVLEDAPEAPLETPDVIDDMSVPVIVAGNTALLNGGKQKEAKAEAKAAPAKDTAAAPSYDTVQAEKQREGKTSATSAVADDKVQDKKENGHAGAAAALAAAGSAAGVAAVAESKDPKVPDVDEDDDEEGADDDAEGDEDEDEDDEEGAGGQVANGQGDASGLIAEEYSKDTKRSDAGRKTRREPSKRAETVAPLTPVQRHYLLKALVSLQMQMEWSELEKLGGLTQYGYPFLRERPKLKRVKADIDDDFSKGDFADSADDPYADEDAAKRGENLQEPLILRHMFHVHLHPFPGLDKAPLKYWTKRIQPFFDEMAARNFSYSMERAETTSRHFYTLAFTRYLGGFFARGVGVRGQGETRGPGRGDPGSERWGPGKQWGKGTVKRGLDKPARIDDDLMAKIDDLFDGKEGEVWRRAKKETKRVKSDWCALKEYSIEQEAGLEEVISHLDIGNIKNLPPKYRNAEEYARMHAAYIFHTLFVTSPSADGIFSVLKGIHALFPYWGAKQLLRVANAQTMVQGILSLLLARPGGAKSLVQRTFTYVIGKEASAIAKEYLAPLRKEINDDELTKKIAEYVKRANRPEGRAIRARAVRTNQDVLATILLYSAGTKLSSSKKDHVLDLHEAFAESPYRGSLNKAYPSSTPAGKEKGEVLTWGAGAVEEAKARKFAMLKLYLRETLKKRDREQAIQVASGSLIPSIIKDSLDTVFYGPFKEIAEVADLSGRLGDLQAFIDDLIQVKKSGDNELPAWIALAARHENSLYFLFHECAPIMQRFTDWLQVGADYMSLSTVDPQHPANRKAKNVEVNLEEMLQDDRLTEKDVKTILAEIDGLASYVKWQKVWYELEMRKNFLLARPDAAPSSGLSEDDLPGGMKRKILDVDGLLRELMEQEGVPVEEGVVRDETRGTEMQNFPWAWFEAVDPLHQHIEGGEPDQLRFRPHTATTTLPSLSVTRKALEPFQDCLISKLPAWKDGSASGVPASAPVADRVSTAPPPPPSAKSNAKRRGESRPGSVMADNRSTKSRKSIMKMPSFFGRK